MYTIGQVAKMFGLPVSTLRYYDKQGLFPKMSRASGIRQFGDTEIEALRIIDCLKRSGLEIKDIKNYMDWCVEGPATYQQRHSLFVKQMAAVQAEIDHLTKVMDMLKFKCWFYDQAIQTNDEATLRAMIPNDLPEDIRLAYERAHK